MWGHLSGDMMGGWGKNGGKEGQMILRLFEKVTNVMWKPTTL